MKIADNTLRQINRVSLLFSTLVALICLSFMLGAKVAWKYDVDQAFDTSRDQLLATMTSYLHEGEILLSFFVLVMVVNIAIVILNLHRTDAPPQ